MSSRNNPARVAIVMGSKSDWATMQFAAEIFEIWTFRIMLKSSPPTAPQTNCSASPKALKRTVIR